MAGWSDDNQKIDEICTFTVLDGVCVRIGEKYKPPKLNETGNALTETKVSKFDYDFKLERKIIASFEAQKQREAAKLEQQKQAAAVADTAADTLSSDAIVDESGTEISTPSAETNVQESSTISNGLPGSYPTNTNVEGVSPMMLKPTKLYGHPGLFDESYSKMPGSINLSEFEDNNGTPFELVEMQSINEFDELMSVLQPGASIPSGQIPANQRDNSPTANHQQSSNVINPSTSMYGTENILLDFNDTGPMMQLPQNSLPAYGGSASTYTGMTFDAYDRSTTDSQLLLASKNSKSLPDLATLDKNTNQPNDVFTDYSLNNTNEQSQFSDGELQERSLSAGSRRQVLDYDAQQQPQRHPDQNNDGNEFVATNRINTIMNQYRFTRLSHDNAAYVRTQQESNPVTTTDDELPPWNRVSVLPPLQISQPSDVGRPASRGPKPSWDLDSNPYVPSNQPVSTESVQINSSGGNLQVSFRKQPTVLPPISPIEQTRQPLPTNEKQEDSGFNLLSTEEKNFASNLSSMGFPLRRVVRAVGHHGCNDKEIVDYLLLVQQLVDNGHKELDVESIVLEVKNNQDEAVAYLQTLCKLTDLGFSNQNVMNALKTVKGDSDAALEMLMSS